MLVPSCGHFGELPKALAAAHNADSGHEAIDALGGVFDGDEGFLKAVLTQLPILLPITAKYAQHEDEDIGDSESSAKVTNIFYVEIKTEFSDFFRYFLCH